MGLNLLEPCCYVKQFSALVDSCEQRGGCEHFFSFSDWTAADLLRVMAGYGEGGTLCVMMVHIDSSLIEALRSLLNRKRVDPSDNAKTLPFLKKVVLIAQQGADGKAQQQREELKQLLCEHLKSERLILCEDMVAFRCVAVENDRHSIVVQGSINLQKSSAMQMFSLTTGKDVCRGVMSMVESKTRTKRILKQQVYE